MTTDVFLVTYPRDYPWLVYFWRAFEKYRGDVFRRVLVIIEEQDQPPELPSYAEIVRCPTYQGTEISGYTGQAVECLKAHLYTDADVIWFAEADTPLVRPASEYPVSRPLIVNLPWEDVGVRMCSIEARDWGPRTDVLLGVHSPSHSTIWPPFVYPRCVLERAYAMMGGEARIRDVLMTTLHGQPISQHDILGTVGMLDFPELFEIVNAEQLAASGRRAFVQHFMQIRDPRRVLPLLQALGLADE